MRMDCLWWRYDSYQASQLNTHPYFLAFTGFLIPVPPPDPVRQLSVRRGHLQKRWHITPGVCCGLPGWQIQRKVHTSEKCIQHLFIGGCRALRSWVFLLYFPFGPHGWAIPVGFSYSFDEQFLQSWSHLHFRQWYLMFTVVCTLVQMFHQLSWMVITMLRWIMSIILILLHQHKTYFWSCLNKVLLPHTLAPIKRWKPHWCPSGMKTNRIVLSKTVQSVTACCVHNDQTVVDMSKIRRRCLAVVWLLLLPTFLAFSTGLYLSLGMMGWPETK